MEAQNVHRWTTKTTYYDTDTGEKLSYQLVKRDYKVIKRDKKTKIEGRNGIIEITGYCQRQRQTRIWD